MTHRILALILLTAASTLRAGPLGDEIRKQIDDYENSVRANTLKIIHATSEEEKAKYRSTIPSAEPCVKKLMELVKANPEDADAVKAVTWLAISGASYPEGQEALRLLTEKYAASAGIAETVKQFEYRGLSAEPFLKAVVEKNTNRPELAAALYALGAVHFKNYDTALDKATVEASKKTAMESFQRLAAEFSDVTIQGFKLNDQASKMLFEMANLQPGCEAPAIQGKDQDGKECKLSDYRGKHVVIAFWGGWCHACHGLMPILSAYAQESQAKPIAVLGVNTDLESEARNAIAQNGANFRHILDNTNSGPNTTLYAPRAFPTLHLIGPDGIILMKNSSLEAIRQRIEADLAAKAGAAGK